MIKLKQLLTEKTLYHGTLIDNVPSIKTVGLIPSVGEFVKDAYNMTGYDVDPDDYLKELVFATDKEQLSAAVNAITAQIGYKLKKGFHDVTDEEFVKYGAIAVIKDGESVMEHRPEGDDQGEYPSTVEPGNYYSEDYIGVDYILTGKNMIKLLRRYREWPRMWGATIGVAGDIENLRTELIRLAVKYHKDRTKDQIIQAVKSIPKRSNLISQIQKYRKLVGEEKPINEIQGYDPEFALKGEARRLEIDLKVEFPQLADLHLFIKSGGEELYLNSIRVKPNERGKGIGAEVMDRILKFADEKGLYTTLHPNPDKGYKEKLLQFYRKFGFYPNRGRRGISRFGGSFGVDWIRPPKKKV